ncbi:hypothetical protein Kpol_1035p28 [Vanderwaltozyma polyspora DSM 70294]|uniref:3-ketodihydrosphingosine reductase TSC10 n=1 Tax=Vanderwaltozyma polyspora (strain ATCC 22028 / DSM 70294 / BCRC 21397 / CBS 2163 / NBRC 10782 / NRRL Y-8283 / UCD 57-17) TaxID=436907 RepID=A7TKJ3_VANPO|nr:uncharacterized protein Kpol_1035p28 [Vanderwaltozyma polyspora DSM 70294]EDO17215.1 hypothetical protein Kpol_1035p28 [Vanderwaltozyma polyspora DSM 70294]
MSYSLVDQVVLITGGSQGLGKQFAKKYYEEGRNCKIIIVSRSEQKLLKAISDITYYPLPDIDNNQFLLSVPKDSISTREINESGNELYYFPSDLGSYKGVANLFSILAEKSLLPTQIISCAGGSVPKLFVELTREELEAGIDVNYKTTLYVSHFAAQFIPSCHLILFSSVTAFYPFIGYSQYAPLKGSVKALASILRQELPYMRISVVYPGNFQSEGYELENMTKPEITKTMEGASQPITCEECCDKIIWWLKYGYDDITTDFIGWFLMSLDMGLNKHNNKSPLWFLQLLLGAITNLTAVPVHMLICSFQIRSWFKKNEDRRASSD